MDPNPRDQLIEDLISFIKTNQATGFEIHLMGDANEDMRKVTRQKGIGKLMHECQLQDLHAHHAPVATHINGSTTIDCMLGSAILAGHVLRSGYTAFYDTHIADHRGLFMDFDAERFYGSTNADQTRPQARLLRSNNPKSRQKYLEYLKANIGDIPRQFSALLKSNISREEAERRFNSLDLHKLSPIIQAAENRCITHGSRESLWSTKLKASLLLLDYWKARKSQAKKHKISDLKIARIKAEIEKIENVDDNGSPEQHYINLQMK